MSSETLTIVAMVSGPVVAVLISTGMSIWYQNRKQKLDAKESLFQTLMMYRKTRLAAYAQVNALNLIDVVFADKPEVVRLWHSYYTAICQPQVNWTAANHDYLDLLSEMAKSLGYKSLSQTDIDKCYVPQGHADLFDLDVRTKLELLRVLENTARIAVDKRDDVPPVS
ncbi:MAG: DUF6680 family protein [Thermodesulfobacteriota bacterium]